MLQRIPAWVFLAPALVLTALGQYPILRVLVDSAPSISMPVSISIMCLTGGLMCGLSAMILLVRRQAAIPCSYADKQATQQRRKAAWIHASGLLLLLPLPLLNFLLCYFLWLRFRTQSSVLDNHGRQALNFQITIYLFLLISLFLTIVVLGFIAIPLIVAFHFICTCFAVFAVLQDKPVHYPTNIKVINEISQTQG